MGELKEKMLRRMELKNFSKKTIELYLYHMKKYVRYYAKSPDKLGKEEIEKYLHFLYQQKVSVSAMVQAYSALKFFYANCLERPWELNKIPRPHSVKRLPIVLSPGEVKSILEHVVSLQYRTILMLIYSSGLRLSEALHLKIQDIDSSRMEIRVEQGKGKKDRYTLLSEIMLNKLREYYKEHKPSDWLFAGKEGKLISNSTIQKIFIKAKKKRASEKKRQYTHCDIVLPLTF
ncbi:MAG: site-specific integrase [Ignavibacterium sp.]|nr:site-specific integrase [Ignavibacterium sp.]